MLFDSGAVWSLQQQAGFVLQAGAFPALPGHLLTM
jgi:hypothetical protein